VPLFRSSHEISTQISFSFLRKSKPELNLGSTLGTHPHHRLRGVDAYRIRVGDYRVIYNFDRSKGILYLLAVGHRREVYRL
jgi:mRNA-degrading endonuclease RelE of RelBE toxin-antitoxin system